MHACLQAHIIDDREIGTPDVSQHGGLLSHFLFDPVTAFCLLVGTKSLDHELYRQARRIVQDFAVTAEGLLANHPETRMYRSSLSLSLSRARVCNLLIEPTSLA